MKSVLLTMRKVRWNIVTPPEQAQSDRKRLKPWTIFFEYTQQNSAKLKPKNKAGKV
jgi:hypothetical protein